MILFDSTPITVSHISIVQAILGINASNMSWLLGVTWAKWSSIQRYIRLSPDRLADPRHAMILRWMIRHPMASPTLQSPPAGDFLGRLRGAYGPITAKSYSLTMGWDASAGHRWLCGAPIGPAGRQALSLLDSSCPERLATNWGDWRNNAKLEAGLRNIDLDKALGWTPARNQRKEDTE
ncbi:hypothetical protein [Paramagnetospirillum caucaseum]|uniref:hypothetical protein n=1 Tax=Paramagnetospirillum caucaseum TaxID=1244869 RepID=UPI0009DAED20|nr:hypothetical protein [Paramagnetospirillum caucaseum]